MLPEPFDFAAIWQYDYKIYEWDGTFEEIDYDGVLTEFTDKLAISNDQHWETLPTEFIEAAVGGPPRLIEVGYSAHEFLPG